MSGAMECYCYLRNIQDVLANGRTPYEKRFIAPFHGPIIPFRRIFFQTHLPKRQTSSSCCRTHSKGEVEQCEVTCLWRTRTTSKHRSHQRSMSKDESPKKYQAPPYITLCSTVLTDQPRSTRRTSTSPPSTTSKRSR